MDGRARGGLDVYNARIVRAGEAQDMAQPFVGQVLAVGFNFAPSGWFLCNGQLLAIAEYQVLFTLIGTTYGGNGTTTFAVPNLNGRAIVGSGQAAGFSNYVLGQNAGTESVTLNANQLPLHTHPISASSNAATASAPASNLILAAPSVASPLMFGTVAPTTPLAPTTIGTAGGNQPHENRQPFLTVNYIIAAFGIFPSRN